LPNVNLTTLAETLANVNLTNIAHTLKSALYEVSTPTSTEEDDFATMITTVVNIVVTTMRPDPEGVDHVAGGDLVDVATGLSGQTIAAIVSSVVALILSVVVGVLVYKVIRNYFFNCEHSFIEIVIIICGTFIEEFIISVLARDCSIYSTAL
jgi:hypothetical protein